MLDEFVALDVQVIGASTDSAAANGRWAEKHGLRMPLICDTGEHEIAKAFGVLSTTRTAKRTTWLIDADGTLRKVYLKVTPKGHAAEVLAAVREVWR